MQADGTLHRQRSELTRIGHLLMGWASAPSVQGAGPVRVVIYGIALALQG